MSEDSCQATPRPLETSAGTAGAQGHVAVKLSCLKHSLKSCQFAGRQAFFSGMAIPFLGIMLVSGKIPAELSGSGILG